MISTKEQELARAKRDDRIFDFLLPIAVTGVFVVPLLLFILGSLVFSPRLLDPPASSDTIDTKQAEPRLELPEYSTHILHKDNTNYLGKINSDLIRLEGDFIKCENDTSICGGEKLGYYIHGPDAYLGDLISLSAERRDLSYARWYSNIRWEDYAQYEEDELDKTNYTSIRLRTQHMIFPPKVRPVAALICVTYIVGIIVIWILAGKSSNNVRRLRREIRESQRS